MRLDRAKPGLLARPGTHEGPCLIKCIHRDCVVARAMAAAPCCHCGHQINYETWFYEVVRAPVFLGITPRAGVLAHQVCEDEANR